LAAFTGVREEQFFDPEEEMECLEKIKKLQYKGDIQDYIIKMEDLNHHICLSGIAWRQALHSGLNKETNNQISFLKITPNDDAEYKLLLKYVDHAYEKCQQEKQHQNDRKPKDQKNNQKKSNDDGDKRNQGKKNFEKGSDSKKPCTEKKGSKPVHVDKGEALKAILESLLEARAKSNKCKLCSFLEHQWVFCKNAIKMLSGKKKRKRKVETLEVTTSSLKVKPRSLAD
jgi:hypothetical protein